jgi:hypothetical protein
MPGFQQVQPGAQPDHPAADDTDETHENSVANARPYRIPYIHRHPFDKARCAR